MVETGVLEIIPSTVLWKIENFSEKCTTFGESITSPTFESSDGKSNWNLHIYPFGYDQSKKDYVSLFLNLMPQSTITDHICTYELSIHDGNHIFESTKRSVKNRRFDSNENMWGWHEFIKRSDLFDRQRTLIRNGMLIISCTISGTTLGEKLTIPTISFESLFMSQDFSDITIAINDKEINAHRAILSIRSTVFSAMLKSDMKEKNSNVIRISDIEYEVMKNFLWFLYSGKVEDIKKSAKSLLPIADRYGVDDLKNLCEATLSNDVTIDNACELASIADLYNCHRLKSISLKFIISHMTEVVKTKGFEEFLSTNQTLFKEIFLNVVKEKF